MTVYLDFETRSKINLTKLGACRYAWDASTQVLCMCWAYDQDEEVHLWHRRHEDKGVCWTERSNRPDELIERIKSGELVEAHNAKFEYVIWNFVLMREFPELFDVPLQVEQMRCSAAKASCLSLRRKLGDAANDIGLTERKDTDGRRLINKLSKPMVPRRKKGVPVSTELIWCEEQVEHERNWAYCAQDVRTERALSDFCPEMTETELNYWFMDFRMNMRGIKLDKAAAEDAIELCRREVVRLDGEMQDLTGGRVLGGSKRIAFRAWANEQVAEINKAGHQMDMLADTRADTLSFALHGVPTKAAEEAKAARKPEMEKLWQSREVIGATLKKAMEICLEVNRSSVAKFRTMRDSVCPDGRLHDIMLYNGADRTGRWSGQGVQPHNFVRGYMKEMGEYTFADKDDPERGEKPSVWETLLTRDELGDLDLDFITLIEGAPLPALAKACRGALIASDDMELYAADFKAIEARKLAWMAGCASQLELFRSGGDPYLAMASAIYDREITKKDKTERQLGKKAVLGLGYNMGWEKFQATVWAEEGIWLEDNFCKKVVNIYRKKQCPEMPVLWKAIERAAIAAVQDGAEHYAGGDPVTGAGQISYFVNGRFLHCRLPSGRLLAYLDPEVHERINYRYMAKNERGTPCLVTFQSKIGVPMSRVRRHAEQIAERQRKTLDGEQPETFLSPHLSFMGRHIVTKEWKRLGTHGGSLTENANQASSRDLLAEAMYRVDQDERFALLLSIHDEVIAEAPIGTMTVPEFEAIMSEVPIWAPGMPIEAEGWKGPRLRK